MQRLCQTEGCHKVGKYRCGKCKIAAYCSKECQARDWKLEHERICLDVGGAREDSNVGGLCMIDGTVPSGLEEKRLVETSNYDALLAAKKLKDYFSKNSLNVVTIESLTSGMIAKMLTDIPGSGVVLYGGFVVYDTDAKRMWAGVRTRGVYTEQTAYQMAYGSLLNSRAMVSIAVTGHAMPFFDDRDELGIVDIGVAVRTTPTITVETCRVEHCIGKDVNGICTAWKNLHSETGGKKTFPPFQITAMVADVIRLRTSAYAMRYATVVVERIIGSGAKFDNIAKKSWDAECKPSWIIETRLVDSHDVSKTEPKGNDAADIKETADIPYFM